MSTYTTPAGVTVPVIGRDALNNWTEEMRTVPVGAGGHVAALVDGDRFVGWYWVSKRHPPDHTRHYGAEPPVYPKANPERCGCSKGEHVCGCCGQPYWNEVHGMADGFCTYCYHRG